MERTATLPGGVCGVCATSAKASNAFLNLCKKSDQLTKEIADLLNNVNTVEGKRGIYVVINNCAPRLVTDRKYAGDNATDAIKRITTRLSQEAESAKRTAKQKELRDSGRIANEGEKNATYSCPDCSTVFSTVYQLNRHLANGPQRFCPHCNDIVEVRNLKRHFKSHNLKMFPCGVCPEVFDSEQELESHWRLYPGGPFICDQCEHGFPTVRSLKSHCKVHALQSCGRCFSMFRGGCLSKHIENCTVVKSSDDDAKAKTEYVCPDCDSKFKNIYALDQHIKEGGYKVCRHCNGVIGLSDFREHLLSHNVIPYDCPKCPKSFEHVHIYKAHVKVHAMGKHVCVRCEHTFKSNSSLMRHARLHRSIRVSCSNCRREFTNRKCYERHVRQCLIVDTKSWKGSELYECPNCSAKFLSWYYLNLHLKDSRTKVCKLCHDTVEVMDLRDHMREHGVVTYDCKVCPATFISRTSLKTHRRTHTPRPYACAQCKHTFENNTALLVHELVHRIRTCPGCSKRFDNRKCYQSHAKKCNIQPQVNTTTPNTCLYICDYCNNEYTNKLTLKSHIKSLHMRIRSHQCEECGNRFATTSGLKEHRLVHNKVDKFTCEVCSAVITTKRGYKRHLLKHSGRRPHVCPCCQQSFFTASEKTRHVLYKHKERATVVSYPCTLCPAKYAMPMNLQKHMESKHSMSLSMFDRKCGFCSETFAMESDYVVHLRSHLVEVDESDDDVAFIVEDL